MAVAVVRVFIGSGDRTDRKRARLKYVLDEWGIEKFMAAVAQELSFTPARLSPEQCEPRGPVLKQGHIGIHNQKQAGFSYAGVALPVGRLSVAHMRGLADIAQEFGSGTIRLTVWQNLILSDIPNGRVPALEARIVKLGLATRVSAVRGGLVACTGNTGCKFSATDTKGQATVIADYLDRRIALDQPINIHLTGCPNSCAQHYVGDIGLLGIKVGDDLVEGYSIMVGGGAGSERSLARELYQNVPMADVPSRLERILASYLAHRRDRDETFHDFTRRHSVEELKRLFEPAGAAAA
jgi:ferredoxin-nitrite reductase